MRRIGLVIAAAIVAGVGSWFFGSGILPAIVIGIGIGTVALVLRLASVNSGARDWPPPPPVVRDGSRHESSDLSWAIRGRDGAVDDRIVGRIRRIAADRLAARQLDLENPAHAEQIQRLIGSSTYDVLMKPAVHAVRISDVLGMLDILDRIRLRPTEKISTESAHAEKSSTNKPTDLQLNVRMKKKP